MSTRDLRIRRHQQMLHAMRSTGQNRGRLERSSPHFGVKGVDILEWRHGIQHDLLVDLFG